MEARDRAGNPRSVPDRAQAESAGGLGAETVPPQGSVEKTLEAAGGPDRAYRVGAGDAILPAVAVDLLRARAGVLEDPLVLDGSQALLASAVPRTAEAVDEEAQL